MNPHAAISPATTTSIVSTAIVAHKLDRGAISNDVVFSQSMGATGVTSGFNSSSGRIGTRDFNERAMALNNSLV